MSHYNLLTYGQYMNIDTNCIIYNCAKTETQAILIFKSDEAFFSIIIKVQLGNLVVNFQSINQLIKGLMLYKVKFPVLSFIIKLV